MADDLSAIGAAKKIRGPFPVREHARVLRIRVAA
jgi:hypothetical protein